jgi:CDP-glucose 4,6-dehydratase
MVDSLFHTFYEDKTVLVTGHTGFKGGWLVTWLKMLGAHVIGYSLPPENSKRNLFGDANVGEDMVSILGDIRNLSSLKAVFETHKPEIVFHLAAQSLVRRSYLQPVNTYTTNVIGTVNVLEVMRHAPSMRAAVIVTSDKCYENRDWIFPYREIDPMGGYDPYSSSKGCAELVTAAYRNSFFREKDLVAVASARAGNVIGGGDWAEDRLLPDVVSALSSGLPVVLRNPDAVRPWQHVLEPLRGYLALGKLLCMQGNSFAEAWNFGPNEEDCVSVREVVAKIIRLWGTGEVKVQADPHCLHEAGNLRLYCGKARERLGWRPLLTLDEAIEMTVSGYRTSMGTRASAAKVIEGQIQDYMERIA